MKEHFEMALLYIRENHKWSDICEEYALELIGELRCTIDIASPEIAGEISSLLDEYTADNSLPEDWWTEFGSIDEIYSKL